MSQYLDRMSIGDTIDVKGPSGRLIYKRNGKIIIFFNFLLYKHLF